MELNKFNCIVVKEHISYSMILMNISSNHKIHTLVALFLFAVLFGSIIIKPVHILLVHHQLTEIANPNEIRLSSPQHHDCKICDFEFCSFIPQKQVIVPQVNIIYANELASRAVACFVSASSRHFQLRAPPVF
jgi:hypothetical protein